MEKFPTNIERIKNKYETLKEGLLGGALSLSEVREKLIEWDQSTPTRDASNENLVFLHDPQVVKYVEEHPEAIEKYHYFLSFTEFHVAQRIVSSNPDEALEHFEKALESAQIVESGKSWAAYVAGTLTYMKGKEIPEDIIAKVEQPRNAQILRNFNSGLKERGSVSYIEDYSK